MIKSRNGTSRPFAKAPQKPKKAKWGLFPLARVSIWLAKEKNRAASCRANGDYPPVGGEGPSTNSSLNSCKPMGPKWARCGPEDV